jgi:hypothetical protein
MINLSVKPRKNRVVARLRRTYDYRLPVLLLLAIMGVFLPFMQTNAATEGDGRIIYGDGTAVTPKTRTWQSNARTMSAEASLPTAGATVKATIIEATSVRDEMIAGVLNSGNLLTVYRWNGTAWSTEWTVTLPATNTPSFDVAYEQVSGKAMVVYSRNATTNEIVYRTWDGAAWGAATNLASAMTSGIVHAIVATARPGTNEIAIAYGDANLDLSANYWSGSAWLGEHTAALETNLARIDTLDAKIQTAVFDVEFEQQSGEVMIAWARDGEDGIRRAFRIVGSGAQWRIGFHEPISTHRVRSIALTADPSSDYIAVATEGEVTINSVTSWAIVMSRWDGSAWKVSSTSSFMDNAAYGQHRFDIGWVENNGQVRAIWSMMS